MAFGSIWPSMALVKFERSWVDICKRNEGKVTEFLKCAFRDESDFEVWLLEPQHQEACWLCQSICARNFFCILNIVVRVVYNNFFPTNTFIC